MIWFLLLVLPGAPCAYFIFLRPTLHAIPALKSF